MDIFNAHKVNLSKFIRSPAGKGYFVPNSQIRKKSVSGRHGKSGKRLRIDVNYFKKDYFDLAKRDSPAGCKIVRLTPVARGSSEKSTLTIRKSVSRIDMKNAETNMSSDLLQYSRVSSKIYLPAINYINDIL